MNTFKETEDIILTLCLPDEEADLYVRCKVFGQLVNDITPGGTYITLVNAFKGLYSAIIPAGTFSNVGVYTVYYEIYADDQYIIPSAKYGAKESKFRVSDMETKILTEIPDNILLDDDPRLDNLNTVPDLATTLQLTSAKDQIIGDVNTNTDNNDGNVV